MASEATFTWMISTPDDPWTSAEIDEWMSEYASG